MNKKFLSGTVFGLALGLGIGISTPMIAASNNAKNIVIPKRNTTTTKTQTTTTNSNASEAGAADMKEAVALLKDISKTLKDNASDNKQVVNLLNSLVARQDVNPLSGEKYGTQGNNK